VRRGQAVPAQSLMPPAPGGYDPAFKSEMSEHSPARAKALLDLYGYLDRDGDGWREQPDGRRWCWSTRPSPTSYRQFNELWKKLPWTRIGVRIEFKIAKWPEQPQGQPRRQADDVGLGWSAAEPDGERPSWPWYGPKGQGQPRALRPAGLQRAVRPHASLPDGPERDALIRGQEAGGGLHALQGARAPHLPPTCCTPG
jgi:ABC-type transport system substrate-binding protein